LPSLPVGLAAGAEKDSGRVAGAKETKEVTLF